jgi:hypothetical protein
MTKRLYRVAVDAAQPVLDATAPRKPVNITISAPNERKALEQAKLAIMQNPEAAEKYKGKVVVNLEDFNALPVTEKAAIAPLSESRSAKKAAEGLKSGEQGRVMIEPHKLTVEGEKVAWPAFNVNDPKYKAIGMEHANAGHLIQKGDATVRPQKMTILPDFLEKALSDDSSRLRPLGRFLGIADDMEGGWRGGWANNKGKIKRLINTTKTNLIPAAGIELLSSKLTPQDDGSGGKENGEWLSGNGYVMRPVKALAEMAGVKKSDEDRVNEQQGVLNKIAQEAKESKALLAVKKMSPAGIPSREAFDINSQSIARAIGDKSENGAMAHRVYEEAIRPMFKSAQGSDDAERISNATRRLFETQSADQIVESLLFKASKAEKDMYQARAQRQTAEGQRPDEFKPVMHDSFKRFLGKFQSDDINTPYITFPTDMTTSFHDGQQRTGFKVTRAYPDSPRGETIFVIPVIVPKKTKAEQNLLGTAAKKGDADIPTMSDRMAEDKYEVIYIDANPKNLRKPEVPRDQIIW